MNAGDSATDRARGKPRQFGGYWVCTAVVAAFVFGPDARLLALDDPPTLAAARQLFLTGRYAEAEEAYRVLAEAEPVAAAIGTARCQAATGQRDAARRTLAAALDQRADDAALLCELALLALEGGDYGAAAGHAEQALAVQPEALAARWVQAELARLAGKLPQAEAGYRWFVDYYNGHDRLDDPEALRWIGLAAAQFARWKRLSDQYSFLVNELYPDALKLDAAYWPAAYEAGLLFAEKYNAPQAERELQAALAINANAAPVHAAIGSVKLQSFDLAAAQEAADRALGSDAGCLAAHHLQADIHLANLEPAKAVATLEGALPLNRVHEGTLGRLAAAYLLVDGPGHEEPDSRAGPIVAAAVERNPHAGEFFAALADSFDRARRFPLAARYYRQAIERLPQLTGPRCQLGLMLMRLGQEDEARGVLDEAFAADPFNVRVSNTRAVLEVLAGYQTLETEHFLIRFDPAHDRILARYAAAWLEEVYPQLCRQLGYEPREKSLFEIFNKAKNTDAHGWFSARMVGLPHVHTIGACAGQMVAMQSPVGSAQKFSWARVLQHEFVHVVNLQQTDFGIPHWFTEALAVLNEGQPRPPQWNELLARRFAEDKLFTLDDINLGFVRPHSSDDWTLAYCQAELYAEYLLAAEGPDALAKMLAAYADNLTTRESLRRSFAVEQEQFERGYREHLAALVAGLPPGTKEDAKPRPLAAIERALREDPQNADLLAQAALAHLNRRRYAEARKLVDGALAIAPHHPAASYVRARLHLVVGETKEAQSVLEAALDPAAPQADVLGLLAGLRLQAEDYAEAARLYELGASREPGNLKWTKSLAAVYLQSGDAARLTPILEKLAAADGDDLTIRKKLGELAAAAGDHAAAARWFRAALHIDVMDPAVHNGLAEAQAALGECGPAIEEWQVSLELNGAQPAVRLKLAQALATAGRRDEAKSLLDELLQAEPHDEAAQKLRESLAP